MLVAALLALTTGIAVYVVDRAAGSAYFPPPGLAVSGTQPCFGPLGGWLPGFAYVYVLSLLTALILGVSRRALLASCFIWWAIDTLFEIGQHPLIGARWSSKKNIGDSRKERESKRKCRDFECEAHYKRRSLFRSREHLANDIMEEWS